MGMFHTLPHMYIYIYIHIHIHIYIYIYAMLGRTTQKGLQRDAQGCLPAQQNVDLQRSQHYRRSIVPEVPQIPAVWVSQIDTLADFFRVFAKIAIHFFSNLANIKWNMTSFSQTDLVKSCWRPYQEWKVQRGQRKVKALVVWPIQKSVDHSQLLYMKRVVMFVFPDSKWSSGCFMWCFGSWTYLNASRFAMDCSKEKELITPSDCVWDLLFRDSSVGEILSDFDSLPITSVVAVQGKKKLGQLGKQFSTSSWAPNWSLHMGPKKALWMAENKLSYNLALLLSGRGPPCCNFGVFLQKEW